MMRESKDKKNSKKSGSGGVTKEELKKEMEQLKKDFDELKEEKENIESEAEKINKELEKHKEVSQKAQTQYLNLKKDFDSYMNKIDREKEDMELNLFIENLKKILPLVEELRKSVESVPEEIESNDWVKGISMVYDKFLKKLNELGVEQMESCGETPDPNYHEPIGMENTDEEEKKSKIIKEFEKGYVYKGNEQEKIIQPAKVIVGQ